MKEMHLAIVSPEQTVFDGKVTQVTLPGEYSRFQVLYNHAAIISTLVSGEVSYTTESGETRSLDINGGFVEVNHNDISVCAEL